MVALDWQHTLHEHALRLAIRAGDDPDIKIICLEVRDNFGHRQIELFTALEVREAFRRRLHELADIVVIFWNRHAGKDRRLRFRLFALHVTRNRMRIDGVLDDLRIRAILRCRRVRRVFECAMHVHHPLEIRRRALAEQRAIHIKDSDAVLDRDEVRALLVRDVLDVVRQSLERRRILVPVLEVRTLRVDLDFPDFRARSRLHIHARADADRKAHREQSGAEFLHLHKKCTPLVK